MPLVIELLCSSYWDDHMQVIGLVGRVECVGRIEVHVAVFWCGNLSDVCHVVDLTDTWKDVKMECIMVLEDVEWVNLAAHTQEA
jgi:hypothetical protein